MATQRRNRDNDRKTALFDSTVIREAQEATEFLANVLEASTEYSIIGKDIDDKILLWNEGARRMYGYTAEEVVGKASSDILHTPEDVALGKPRQIMDAAMYDGKWEGVIGRVRKDGKRITARVVITPRRDASGRPVGFLLISKNVSDEIRLTEELRASQYYTRSLIESNIDALMTTDPLGIITDVNQQMEALTGYSREELIGTPFKTYFTDPQRAEEGIKLVLREGKVTNYELTARGRDGHETVVSYNAATFYDRDGKLQGVFAAARDVTEHKRFEQTLQEKNVELENANRVELHFEPVSCQSIIHEVATALRPLAEHKGLTFTVDLPSQDLVMLSDRRALSQILINLTTNAIKFTERGEIRLQLYRHQDHGRTLTVIHVIDTGIGIRQEDQDKLFEAFSQLDVAAARRPEGTGLGLHLSHKLVTLLQGSLAFVSAHGRGSTFTLTLPDK